MHALRKILADHAHPRPASVKAGVFLEVEPDVFAFQMTDNAEEVDKLEADLRELGVAVSVERQDVSVSRLRLARTEFWYSRSSETPA